MTLLVSDLAVADIDRELACREPERGGALMGPFGLDAVSRFVLDEDARTTPATYEPSSALRDLVRELEQEHNLRYRGIAHSHPEGIDRLSGPDRYELAVGLELNPHMGGYLAPLVTVGAGSAVARHEVDSAHGKISFFNATRASGEAVDIAEIPVRVVPVGAALEGAAAVIGVDEIPRPRELELQGLPFLALAAEDGRGVEWSFLVPWHLEIGPPIVMRDGVQLSLPWDLRHPVNDRLAAGIQQALQDEQQRLRGNRRPALPPRQCGRTRTVGGRLGAVVTRGIEVAVAHGLEGLSRAAVPKNRTSAACLRGWALGSVVERLVEIVSASGLQCLSPSVATATHDRLERTATILAPAHAASRHVLIIGLGSVGSRIANELARTGGGSLTLVDPDRVQAANLSRSPYEARDVGRAKVDALARLLKAAAPGIALRRRRMRVNAEGEEWLRGAMTDVDLVIAATDDPAAQLILNRLAAEAGAPSLYIGLTARGHGGEVLLVSPGRTPCYACALAVRQAQPSELRPAMDYGAARLDGEPALGCDVAHVTTAAVRLALSLLAPRDSRLADFAARVIADETTYLTMGMTPGYWFFPALFADTRAQYAFQSAWLTPTRRSDCPICGHDSAGGAAEPSLAALRSLAVSDHPPTTNEEDSP